jgi:hypothetical protein
VVISNSHMSTMFSSNSTDVVSLYRACVNSFKVLFRSLSGSDSGALSTEARLRDDLGRLRVWGETAGAHRDRTSQVSLDHRLREASDIKRTVLKLLSSLNSALKEGKAQ